MTDVGSEAVPAAPPPAAVAGIYRRILGYSARYWFAFLAAAVGMAMTAAVEAGLALLMKPLTDAVSCAKAGWAQSGPRRTTQMNRRERIEICCQCAFHA